MKEKTLLFLKKLVGSLYTEKGGFSARKLTAFTVVSCSVTVHVVWLKHAYLKEDFSLMIELLIVDFTFISVCLGLTTMETLIKLKNLKNEKPSDNT